MSPVVKALRVRSSVGTPLWRLTLSCGHVVYRGRWELGNPNAPHFATCPKCPTKSRRPKVKGKRQLPNGPKVSRQHDAAMLLVI